MDKGPEADYTYYAHTVVVGDNLELNSKSNDHWRTVEGSIIPIIHSSSTCDPVSKD